MLKNLKENNFFIKIITPINFTVILPVLIFLLLTANNYSQQENLKFKHITSDDGLSQNFISCILQDQKGFMWFGSKDGLNRYDGYSFVVYQHDPFDTTTISDNFITSLFEDSRGYIWVGTLNGGLNCLQRETETFIRIHFRSVVSESFADNEIKSIAEDAKGNIWIGTHGDGIFKLTIQNKNPFKVTYKQFENKSDNKGSLNINIVNTLHFDSNGTLWIGTKTGLVQLNTDTENFTQFNIQTKNPK